MAACEKVPNLISFFVCAKLRLKILLSGPQCCPRNRKILHQMTVNYKYGPVIHFQRMENVAFLKTSRCSFNQNCSNMSKSLVLWSRFGSFGEKTTWGSAEIHNIRFMAILCNFWLKIILVKNCTLLEILTHCAGRKRRSPLWFPSNYQEKFAFCWYLLLLLLLCGDFQQREKEGMVSSCVQNFDPSVSAAGKDQMYFSSHSMKKIYEIKEVQLMKIKYLDFYYSIARLLFFKGSLSTKLETLVGLCTNVTISKSRFLIIK